MNRTVFDASAVLAIVNQERGFEQIVPLLAGASISAVNLAEVGSKLVDEGASGAAVRVHVEYLGLEVVPLTADLAFRVAELRRATRGAGLSLGDRACLATAELLGVPVVTADQSWTQLKLDIPIQVVR